MKLGLIGGWLCILASGSACALEAYDRHNQRQVEIVSLVGGDDLRVGSLLELAAEDTLDLFVGEVLALRRIGHDIELEVLDRVNNSHLIIEFPADGLSDITR